MYKKIIFSVLCLFMLSFLNAQQKKKTRTWPCHVRGGYSAALRLAATERRVLSESELGFRRRDGMVMPPRRAACQRQSPPRRQVLTSRQRDPPPPVISDRAGDKASSLFPAICLKGGQPGASWLTPPFRLRSHAGQAG